MIVETETPNVIAQSKNGTGKTMAFALSSILRIDPSIKTPQVVVIAHTREMVLQIFNVYGGLTEDTEYRVKELSTQKKTDAHILIGTLSTFFNYSGSKRGFELDWTNLRMVIIDEADRFFTEQKDIDILSKMSKPTMPFGQKGVQWVLFSATYNDDVKENISLYVKEAKQISLAPEKLKLDTITQFEYKCKPKGKVDFLMDMFNICGMTQTIIFVNTKKFAETLLAIMRKNGLKVYLIFGDMDAKERDEYIDKFRK
jgi:superfamily II DNA/RNA helicase